jgi:hypothetical protein
MAFNAVVKLRDGSDYRITRLLANAKSNTKLFKSDKAGTSYASYSLSLAPSKASGFNLCPSASGPCIASCIYTSGLAGVFPRTILPPRLAKSIWLRTNPEGFKARLLKELGDAYKLVSRKGLRLAVRLNVFSDVEWEKEMPEIFSRFSNVTFYDYTKIYDRMMCYLRSELPSNYHLTFSWSGRNKAKCLAVLKNGGNVAVPFHIKKSKPLPQSFMGFEVIDSDQTDLRFLDKQGGVICGLRAKGKGRRDTTGFVVDINNTEVKF